MLVVQTVGRREKEREREKPAKNPFFFPIKYRQSSFIQSQMSVVR